MSKSSIAAVFATDAAKENDGIVIQYGDRLKVKIARAGGANERFSIVTEEKTRSYRRMIEAELLPRDMDKQLTREIFAEAVLLGWEGYVADVDDKDSPEIPYTPERGVQEFIDNPDFLSFIIAESRRAANFRKKELKDSAGN